MRQKATRSKASGAIVEYMGAIARVRPKPHGAIDFYTLGGGSYAAMAVYSVCRIIAEGFGRICSGPVSGMGHASSDLDPNSVHTISEKRHTVRQIQILLFILLPLLFMCGCSSRAGDPVLEPLPTSETAGTSSQKAEQQKEPAPKESEESDEQRAPQKQVTVHVCGAVRKEGVYVLPEGSRILDAVEAAGGFSENADKSFLNLAMQLEDAWQIRVPSKEETENLRKQQGDADQGSASVSAQGNQGIPGDSVITDGADSPFIVRGEGSPDCLSGGSPQTGTAADAEKVRINLNTASKEELMKIPGVGEAKAQRIIDYREQNGRFEAIEDLMKVPGIKNASFQKMKEYITV